MQKITFLFLLLFSVLYSCSPYKNIEKMQHMSDLKYPYDVKFQKLANDVKLAYIDEGKGEQTIIFIHGLGSYLPAWNKNVEALKFDYRCIAIDLPGYGKSSKNPHSGLMSFYAEVVKQFIDSLGIKNPILAGHSMGGQISMVAALQYPEKIGKLILVDPAGFERFNEGQKEWFKGVMTLDAVKKTTADGILTNLAYNFYKLPKEAEFMVTDRIAMRTASDFELYCHAVVQSVSGMVSQPVIDKLDQISQPALIIFGANDNLIPNRYLNPGTTEKIAKNGASKIKNSTLKLIDKAGHFAMFEKAEECNQAIKDFLK